MMYSTYKRVRARGRRTASSRSRPAATAVSGASLRTNDGKVWSKAARTGVPSGFQFPIVYGNFNVPDQFERTSASRGGTDSHCGYAGRDGGHADAGWVAEEVNPATAMTSSRSPPAQGARRRALFRRTGRAHRRQIHPENQEGLTIFTTRIRETSSSSRSTRTSSGGHHDAPDGTMYITTCTTASSRSGTSPGPAPTAREGRAVRPRQGDHKGRISGGWSTTVVAEDRFRSAAARFGSCRGCTRKPRRSWCGHLEPPERLVARHGAAAARAKQDKSVVPALRTIVRTSPNLLARFHAWDARRTWCAQRDAGATADGRSRAADAHSGNPRQRNALQGRASDPGQRTTGR